MFCLPISTFMYLWAIYIFPGSVCQFAWDNINRSQIHECRYRERGCAVSFLGIHKLDFRYSAGYSFVYSEILLDFVRHCQMPYVKKYKNVPPQWTFRHFRFHMVLAKISSKTMNFSCTVQTVAADLRQGEHIPKMQNDIGHKSKLRKLRQRGGKEAGGGGAGCHAVPCRAGPRCAALGLALRSPQLPWIYARSNTANSAAAAPKTPRWARTDFLQISYLPLYQLRHAYLMEITFLDT